MNERPFNINRLFFIAKKHLNYSRNEFFDSTYKEIVDLIEELTSTYENENENVTDGYVEKVVNIDEIPFL